MIQIENKAINNTVSNNTFDVTPVESRADQALMEAKTAELLAMMAS